jgi:hypothetical protein
MHDDAGAVAILVALSVSTFLLAFAALAVDFGRVYTEQGELQSIADAAALAGATELPDAAEARRRAVATICSDANRLAGWDTDGTCPTPPDDIPAWAEDGDPDTGEILLYARDEGGPDNAGDGVYTPDEVAGLGEDATAIRVKLPPQSVEFGLARSFGADSVTLGKTAATARLGTPTGAGVLPFVVTTDDLDVGADRHLCVIDPDVVPPGPFPGATTPEIDIRLSRDPTAFFFLPRGTYNPPTLGKTLGVDRTRRFDGSLGPPLPTNNPRVLINVDGTAQQLTITGTPTTDRISVLLPALTAGRDYQVWVEADGGVVTDDATLHVTGAFSPPPAGTDPCAGSGRGILDIGRRVDGVDANDDLQDNLKRGIDPQAHRYFEVPTLIADVGALIGSLRCNLQPVPLFAVLINLIPGAFHEHINCVAYRDRGFAAGLTDGLLDDSDTDDPGRLLQKCSDDDFATRGRTIDGTDLFSSPSDLVNGGDGDQLLDNVTSGNVDRERINGDAFRCPRLGMVPVVDPGTAGLGTLIGGLLGAPQYPIVDFTYVWIDDDDQGLIYQGATANLRGVRFRVIDPGFFEANVTGSPKVGPYLGDAFPREVLLVRDVDD